MNKKRADMLSSQTDTQEDDVLKRIDKLNDNDFQREMAKAHESGNPEEIEAFEKKWGLNQYGIDAIKEKLRKEGVDVDSPVYDDGTVRFNKSNYKVAAKIIMGSGHDKGRDKQ